MLVRIPLDTIPSLSQLLSLAQEKAHTLFLDSASSHPRSRYSYFLTAPRRVFKEGNPLDVVAQVEAYLPAEESAVFSGGLAGFLGFECARYLDEYAHIPFKTKGEYFLGFYEWALVIDHHEQKSFLASSFLETAKLEEIKKMFDCENFSLLEGSLCELSCPDKNKYEENIKKIQEYLKAGDVYQINYTEEFVGSFEGSSAGLYRFIREKNEAPYGAFINTGDGFILSFSPECLVETKGRDIATYPIKGTVKRATDTKKDEELKSQLMASVKDKAEHVMIVDLERNDLGKICESSSVTVDSLFGIESFSHVHHLVSRVSGKLKAGIGYVDILNALFPGGSVTGAPKRRALEIIAELEDHSRFVYTGALGFWGVGGLSILNIPIRTLTLQDTRLQAYAGGGIVVDSTAEKEYEEMMLKVGSFTK